MHSDMYVLPLGECDVVLGVQLLQILGPILWDFTKLWMKFMIIEGTYTLKGLHVIPSQIISSHHIEKLIHKGEKGMMVQLFLIQLVA